MCRSPRASNAFEYCKFYGQTREGVLVLLVRWLKQMGGVQETPIISYMHSATADPLEDQQSWQAPELSQAQMSQADGLGEEAQEEPRRGAGGYRLTFNTSPRCFSGTNAQVSTVLSS